MSSRQEGSTACHLANGGTMADLTGGDTGCLFLIFGKFGNIANCPLSKVLTYKNLIYLLICNFQEKYNRTNLNLNC